MLDIHFDSYAGESFYSDKMQPIVDELIQKGLLTESRGAKVVDLEEYGMPPCIILKSDGSSLYATRDMAAAQYRKNEYDFDKYNEYLYNERITTNKYYLENNKYSNSYINNFSLAQNSSTETNVFDFMYFSLEICAVVITIFAMMQICNLITNETESGTITLLLVRPYKRGKIITAKLLTTIFFVLTFMLFASLITFAGGMAMFGYESRLILAVFNSQAIFEISPILLMQVLQRI